MWIPMLEFPALSEMHSLIPMPYQGLRPETNLLDAAQDLTKMLDEEDVDKP